MPTRIEDILTKARYPLADANKERWTDERLLMLVDEAQKDIAHHTKLLKSTYEFAPIAGQKTYTLPDDVWLITRVTFDNEKLDLVSHDTLDRYIETIVLSRNRDVHDERTSVNSDFDSIWAKWEVEEGSDIEAIIYDRRNQNEISVYPIPNTEIYDVSATFTNPDSQFANGGNAGSITEVDDYTLSSVYGVTTDIYDPIINQENINSQWGLVTSWYEISKYLKVYYIKSPATLTSVNDDLVVPPMYDKALEYYVIATAFSDDINTGSEAKADKFMAKYAREITVADETKRTNATNTSQQYRTIHRNPFS